MTLHNNSKQVSYEMCLYSEYNFRKMYRKIVKSRAIYDQFYKTMQRKRKESMSINDQDKAINYSKERIGNKT